MEKRNYICQFIGGPKQGMMDYAEAVATCDGFTEDLSKLRCMGVTVFPADLDNQPMFDGYYGPTWCCRETIGGVEYDVLNYEWPRCRYV